MPDQKFSPTRGTLITLMMASMLNCMGGAAVAPALPLISGAFPQSPETMVALVITLPSLAVAISGFFVGAIADRVGKAISLVVSLTVFTLAGLGGVFAPNLEVLLVERFVMGLGIAGVSTVTTALIADYYDADQQARILGLQSASTGFSILLLESAGGLLATAGWRVPFVVYAIGIPMIVCAVLFVREPRQRLQSQADSAALAKRQAGTQANAQAAAQANAQATAQANAEALSNAHASSQARLQANAAKNSSAASRMTKAAIAVVVICIVIPFLDQSCAFLGPSKMSYVAASFGASTALSGLFLGASGLANILFSLAYARLVRRLGRFNLLGLAFLLTGAGCLMSGLAQSVWPLLPGIVLVNGAVGLIIPLCNNWMAWVATSRNSGKLMGCIAMMTNLGQFFCPWWSGVLLSQGGTYSHVYLVAAVACVVVAVAAFAGRLIKPGLQTVRSE